MIKLDNVTLESFENAGFEIPAGVVCKLLAASENDKNLLLQILLARKRPQEGTLYLLGKDVWSLEFTQALSLYRSVGIIPADGGIISNLKVWENIVLPVWYHKGRSPGQVEDEVIDIYIRLGFDRSQLPDYLSKQSELLPAYEKRIIAMVRSMLMEPKVMVYDSLFSGVNQQMGQRIFELTDKFQTENPDRTTVYLSSSDVYPEGLKADIVFKQDGRGFVQ